MGAVVGGIVGVVGAAIAAFWLRAPASERRSPEDQAALERAVAAVDRELAADLELTSAFDQTKQPVVLENGEYLAARATLERDTPAAFALVSDVYARIPLAEAAMERRGPAGSIPEADLAVVHAWEGDAREAQRVLRAALATPIPSRWEALTARLRARFAAR